MNAERLNFSDLVGVALATGAVVAVAGAAYVNSVQRAVTAVVVILALGNVAGNAEIDIFHNYTSVKLLCA